MPRLTLEYTKEVADKLEILALKLNVSKAIIVQRALATYAFLHQKVDEGYTMAVVDSTGEAIPWGLK